MIRKAFLDQQMGYACAVGIILTIVVMVLQKLSTFVMESEGAESGRRKAVSWLLLAVGVGLAVYDRFNAALNLSAIATVLILIGFPYRAAVAVVKKALPKAELISSLRAGPSRGDAYVERSFRRQTNPVYRALHALGGMFLRTVKHGYIWLVLAFAFLPLYLMMIVSVKNNEQFYLAPATLTQPFHWENWRTAWDMVTPTVANSLFIATSSTMITLGLALCGAYFFARLKVPGASFLWNALLILMMMPAIANLVPLFILLRNLSLLNTLAALIIVGASGGQIFGIFVLRNFISDTPQDLFEAAEIDGANHFQQLKMIVIPLSGPILGTVGVMQFFGAWNDFVLPLIVMRDHARLPVMVQLLRMAGEYIKLWGPLMAGYAIASIPIIILFVFSMKLFIRGMTEGAVKG